MTELYAVLEQFRESLINRFQSIPRGSFPIVGDWLVVSWHYNIDGGVIEGERFNLTFRDYAGIFSRIYSKKLFDGKLHARLEKVKTPNTKMADFGIS